MYTNDQLYVILQIHIFTLPFFPKFSLFPHTILLLLFKAKEGIKLIPKEGYSHSISQQMRTQTM